MEFESISKLNTDVLCTMFIEMWPDESTNELEKNVRDILTKTNLHAVLSKAGNDYTGFIYLSLRSDYVPGATHYPVAYVEGIYIRTEFRKKGIARQLMNIAEDWARTKGSMELASDVEIDNTISQNFHSTLGFNEEERVVSYIKNVN